MSALRELRERVARQFPGEIWVQRHPSGTECFIYSERAGRAIIDALIKEEDDNADQ